LCDFRTDVGALDEEVLEADVLDYAPVLESQQDVTFAMMRDDTNQPPPRGLVVAFVASGLGNEVANPSFDVGCRFHVLIVGKDVGVFDEDVDHRGVFEVLTKAANSNCNSAVACNLRLYQLYDSSSTRGGGVTFWTKILYILA